MATKKRSAATKSGRTKGTKATAVRRGLRDRKREIYREAILETAEAVFERRGFAGTTMAGIARAAGLATGTLYNYFKGKDEILDCLVEHVGEEHLARLSEIVAATTDPTDRLRGLISGCFESVMQRSSTFAALAEDVAPSESSLERMEGDTSAGRYFRVTRKLLEDALRDGAQVGVIRNDMSSSGMTAFLTGAMSALVRDWLRAGKREDLRVQGRMVVELFLRGAAV